jgi:RNA polymerase primary sigma factor
MSNQSGNRVPSGENAQDAQRAFLRSDRQTLDELLDPREQKVLRLKLGLEDGRRYNNHEVKVELGIGDERVRQIEAQALAKLTKALEKGGI